MAHKVHKQLTLSFPKGRGGKRRGAGRKPKGPRAGVRHAARAELTGRQAAHVTLRMRPHVWNLRSRRSARVLREAFVKARARYFRIVQFSVQGNHLHLIVEADSARALARGVQGLSVRIARGLNRMMERTGKVFSDRYHGRVLRTPREVRHALAYVMNNFRRHAAQRGERLPFGFIDPYSSAAYFDGWLVRPALDDSPPGPPPVAQARSWLLTVGWKRHGKIRRDEIPAD
jgi:REP element-mobilizing transposase RayT